MVNTTNVTNLVTVLRTQTEHNSITPEMMGQVLQAIVSLIGTTYSASEIERIKQELDKSYTDFATTNQKKFDEVKKAVENYLNRFVLLSEEVYESLKETDPDKFYSNYEE